MCLLWHVKEMGKCKCISNLGGLIKQWRLFKHSQLCMLIITWNNENDSVRASYCLFSHSFLCKVVAVLSMPL